MKRFGYYLFLFLFLFVIACHPAYAEGDAGEFSFVLSSDGESVCHAETGDIITVTFTLLRTDKDESYLMHAMQNEIRYDRDFFRLVEGSQLLIGGIEWRDLKLRDGDRDLYMNYLNLGNGAEWQPKTVIGSFQLEVTGTRGESEIRCEEYLVSGRDGLTNCPATCSNLTVVVSSECMVSFVTNCEESMDSILVESGSLLGKLSVPQRRGYKFAGWYLEEDLQNPWDPEKDLVENNMTLYAKWEKSSIGILMWMIPLALLLIAAAVYFSLRKTVQFETFGGTEVPAQHPLKGRPLGSVVDPVKEGCTFAGWFRDRNYTTPWNRETDRVKRNMTLYALWR